jgi:RNA chaperone Hfq
MNSQAILSEMEQEREATAVAHAERNGKRRSPPAPFRFTAYAAEEAAANRQAELFYLQKQIQAQTPMVIVLADGERIEGRIEWYDRNTVKIRGRERVLIYKSAIKYMYKLGENGQ